MANQPGKGSIEIVVVLPSGEEQRVPLVGDATLGREPSNQLPVDDGYLSRRHCRLSLRGDKVSIVDLGSYNGTFVNGQRIHEECFLVRGDVIRIGRTTIYVDWREGAGDSESLRVQANDQRPREGIEPIVRAKTTSISPTYQKIAASLPVPRPFQPQKSDPDSNTLQFKRQSREDLREKKTPVPAPSIEESAVARSDSSASAARRASQAPPSATSRDREGLKVIAQIARVLPSVDDEAEFLDYCLGKVLEVVPAERGVLMRLDPSGRGLYPACVRNALPGRDAQQARRLGVSHTIAKKVVRERVSVLVDDAKVDARFKGASSIQELDVRSILCAPIWLGEKVSGLIYLDHLLNAYMFTEADRELLVAVANLVALGITKGKKS